MTVSIVKEIFTGKAPDSNDVGMKIVLGDGQTMDLHLSRDIAIHLIEQLYISLDVRGLYKRKDLN